MLTAAAMLTAMGLCAQNAPISAHADTLQGEKLVTPSSYEEYLSLNAPADVAATDDYIAIADGKTLFIFDKDRNTWQEYTHSGVITKLHFGNRDQLYFLDGQTNQLYLFNTQTFDAPKETGIVCSTFSIHGNKVYYVNVSAGMTSTIYYAPFADLTAKRELYSVSLLYISALSCWNDELYFVDAARTLYKLTSEGTHLEVTKSLPFGVISMTISEGSLCCATQAGGFYVYNLAQLADSQTDCEAIASYEGNYTDVAANGNDIFLVAGNKIEKFSLTDKTLADYSIGATSSTPSRFDGASEVILVGNRLFIADDNNDRISVYDVHAQAFLPSISCQLDTPIMASYGESLLVSTATQAIVYSVNESTYGQVLYSLAPDKISGNIVGATAIYDSYYLVTDTNYCYTVTKTETDYKHTESLRNTRFAEKVTSDVNGNLYLLNNGVIYRYTEENFLSKTEEGVKICDTIPADTLEIAVDYAGNLYALSSNALSCYAAQAEGLYTLQSTTTFTGGLVYGASNEVLSFTFGIEENAVYFLYKDNYLTVTDGLTLPTVKNIPTEGIAENIFGDTPAQFTVVQTSSNSFLVEVDGSKLQDGEATFSYLSSYRSTQAITALKIGETATYAVLCYRENKASAYKTVLIEKHRQAPLDGCTTTEGYPKTGYLTNHSKAYKFPCMGLPALGEFEKNTQVTLVGELKGLDCEYYIVAYGEQTAYVPKSHVVFFDGTPPITESITVGNPEKNEDAMWRLAYLILGSAAICILVDTLVLRKKDNDE